MYGYTFHDFYCFGLNFFLLSFRYASMLKYIKVFFYIFSVKNILKCLQFVYIDAVLNVKSATYYIEIVKLNGGVDVVQSKSLQWRLYNTSFR